MVTKKLTELKKKRPGRREHSYKPDDQVECGECKEKLRYDSLGKHYKRKHPGIERNIKLDGCPAQKQRKLDLFICGPNVTGKQKF